MDPQKNSYDDEAALEDTTPADEALLEEAAPTTDNDD